MGSAADQPAPAPSNQDALALVHQDHRAVRALLRDVRFVVERGGGTADRQGMLARLAALLRTHGRVEQELLYPALVGRADSAVVAQAGAEHAQIDARLERLATGDPQAADFLAQFDALEAAVLQHLEDEEQSLLPHADGLDLAGLGTEMALRRGALQADAGGD